MSGVKNKVYRLSQENKVYCEDLIKVDDSVFENVYKQVDDILYKIIQYNNKLNENSKYINRAEEKYDENVLNTIPFLAGRGRGKTSALLSVLNNLNNMSSYSWSKLYKSNVKFKVLPYIDAAMLAKKEFIFDVILTEMWDSFDKDIQEDKYVDRYNKYNSEYAIKEIRESFIKVRKAYSNLTQKENEKYTSSEELLPTASVLHELSVSVNLRDEMQELVKQYLTYFSMRDEYHNTYLVIAIDDVDMSGDRAYYILEQLRRFFRINNVIIFMTGDFERLQKVCALRYKDMNEEKIDVEKFINEYLEKVLPYNNRIYLPELNVRHNDIHLITSAKEKYFLENDNEKDMILEFIANKCKVYFDGTRRKRHFLQNETIRSLVNYFAGFDNCEIVGVSAWLKADLRNRLIERINHSSQKKFMKQLLTVDYEDVNKYVLGYARSILGDSAFVNNNSLGQVLYACNLLERKSSEYIDLVNCIIMYYSIIMVSAEKEIMSKIVGDSLFGNAEFDIVTNTQLDYVQGADNKYAISIEFIEKKETLSDIIGNNIESINAWIYSLLYVDIVNANENINVGNHISENTSTNKVTVTLYPNIYAKKCYVSSVYNAEQINKVEVIVKAVINEFVNTLVEKKCLYFDEKLSDDNERMKAVDKIFEKIWNGLFFNNIALKKYNKNIELYNYSIEMIYDIISALNDNQTGFSEQLTSNNEKDCYKIFTRKYNIIYDKLKNASKYYKGLRIKCPVDEIFKNSVQMKLLTDGSCFSSLEEKELFEDRLGSVLLEVQRTRLI